MVIKKVVLFIVLSIFLNSRNATGQTNAGKLCSDCLDQFVETYLDEYFRVLDTLVGGFDNCPDCLMQNDWRIDTAWAWATEIAYYSGCMDFNQNLGYINLNSRVRDWQFRDTSATFTEQDLIEAIKLNAWLDFNQNALPGTIVRPGCNLSFWYTGVIDTTLAHNPDPIMLDITTTYPDSNNLCITEVIGSTFYTLINCDNVGFDPDSAFYGNDTAYYVICDSNTILSCDTGIIIVTVLPDPSLLPVAMFIHDPVFPPCTDSLADEYSIVNNSFQADTFYWALTYNNDDMNTIYIPQDLTYFDTLSLTNSFFIPSDSSEFNLEICLTAINIYGSSTFCDTLCLETSPTAIPRFGRSLVGIYPNPAQDNFVISIDKSTVEGALRIIDVNGRIVRNIQLADNKVLVPASQFSPGLYFVIFRNNKGEISNSKVIIE